MPCPTPSDFNRLIVSLEAPVCEQLRKLGQLSKAVSDAYSCIYNENLTFTEAFAQKICATGCGGDVTTTTGGDVTTTTGVAATSWLKTEGGSYELVVPVGVTSMQYVVVAGGGGGGNLDAAYSPPQPTASSGGGSGGMRVGSIVVTPLETLLIVVGNGTTSDGLTNPTNTGGVSTITRGGVIVVRANGGGGGSWRYCASGIAIGGAGGTGGLGGTGTPGIAGTNSTASPCASGIGGDSVSTIGLAPNAGAGSNGSYNLDTGIPAIDGAIRLTW